MRSTERASAGQRDIHGLGLESLRLGGDFEHRAALGNGVVQCRRYLIDESPGLLALFLRKGSESASSLRHRRLAAYGLRLDVGEHVERLGGGDAFGRVGLQGGEGVAHVHAAGQISRGVHVSSCRRMSRGCTSKSPEQGPRAEDRL